MSLTKRQHYVSQMHLRRFTDARGKLHWVRKGGAEVHYGSPNSIFFERHIYTTYDKDNNKDISLERQFSALEGRANTIIEKIVKAARAYVIPNLTAEEKAHWDLFFYYQWKRVPDFHQHIDIMQTFDGAIEQSLKKFEANVRPLTAGELRNLANPDTRKRMMQNAKVKALSDPGPIVQDALSQKGIAIAKILSPKKSFVIGSFPIVKLAHPDRADLLDPSVEVWLPISSDVVISPAYSAGIERLIPISDERHVRAINLASYKQSSIIAGRSGSLIKSLAGLK